MRSMVGALASILLSVAATEPGAKDQRRLPPLPPFLQVFVADVEPKIQTEAVKWTDAVGIHHGWLTRQISKQRLPAVILVAGESNRRFARRAAANLATVGYAVLTVAAEEKSSTKNRDSSLQIRERRLSRLAAAVRWLRDRSDIFGDRIGAIGWSDATDNVLSLTADQGLQACVLCEPILSEELPRHVLIGLRSSHILLVKAEASLSLLEGEQLERFCQRLTQKEIPCRQISFDAPRGFMDLNSPSYRSEAADQAWFQVYEFLGKYVEDADIRRLLEKRNSNGAEPSTVSAQTSTIADLMRSLNTPLAVRGQVATAIRNGPSNDKQWKTLRSQAALLADVAQLLMRLTPPKGDRVAWGRHVQQYREAAQAIADAARRRDLEAARRSLIRLNDTCARCHLSHR